jgi:hypothetical protein
VKALPSQIVSLFERQPALWGFSVRGRNEVPDNCPRADDEDPLFIGDIGISPAINAEQYAKIFEEVVAALAELLSEQPEAAESLRGRTFARVLH